MMVQRRRITLALLSTLALLGLGACQKSGFPVSDGRAAPALPTSQTSWLQGKMFRLADTKGKPLLIEAWHPS